METGKATKFDIFVVITALAAFGLLLVEKTAVLQPYSLVVGELNLFAALVFLADAILKILSAENKLAHLKSNWFDWLVVIPLINLFLVTESTPFSVIMRQVVIMAVLFSRLRKSSKILALVGLKPAQMLIVTFAFAIGAGTVLLMLPAAANGGVRTSLTDAFFTATSATCVTGLTVLDTAKHFSLFGQLVIMGLIQVGGLGIMTFSVSLALLLRKSIDMKDQVAMQDVLDSNALANVKNLIKFVAKMTFWFELSGAVALFIAWGGRIPNILERFYFSLFHSVSAFCNAGFSTYSDNLSGFYDHPATNLIICLLIIGGGIGFFVVKDLKDNLAGRISGNRRKSPLKVQTKMVLLTTAALVAGGALFLYLAEKNNLLAAMTPRGKFWASLFQSVTCRTAGFNTLAIGAMVPASIFVMIVLMFIGGSPGSTAGGVKTTTFSVLLAVLLSELRGKPQVQFFRRTIPAEAIRKAMIILLFSMFLVAVFAGVLVFVEKKPLVDLVFETVSAFGTVGLTTGITPELTRTGKWLITFLMFIGRIGPLTMGYALLRLRKHAEYQYAEETVAIG